MRSLNVNALLLFVLLNVLAYWVSRRPQPMREKALRLLSWLLLGGNLIRYLIVFPLLDHVVKIPAEFSTVAYFVVPLILLSGSDRWSCWAAYSGLMAGFFYYAVMILAGETLYGADAQVNTCISLLCHGALYVSGYIIICTHRFSERDTPKILLCVGYVGLRALLLRPLIVSRDRMLIYILLDATAVRALCPESSWPTLLPIYYGLLGAFLLATVHGFFRSNEKQYQKFSAPRAA